MAYGESYQQPVSRRLYFLADRTSFYDVLFNDVENAGPVELSGAYVTFAGNTMKHNVLGDLGGQNAVNDGPWSMFDPNNPAQNTSAQDANQDVIDIDPASLGYYPPYNQSTQPDLPFDNVVLTAGYTALSNPDPTDQNYPNLPSKVAGFHGASGQLVIGKQLSNIEVEDNEIDGGWSGHPLEWSMHTWGEDDAGNKGTITGTQNCGIEMEASYVHTRNNWVHNNASEGISILQDNSDVMLENDVVSAKRCPRYTRQCVQTGSGILSAKSTLTPLPLLLS